MEDSIQISLTSAELAHLWAQYMNDSASICILTYFLEKVEDVEIKPVIASALELSQSHIKKIKIILSNEKNAVPQGFTLEEDVDLSAPKLFSDTFVLNFLHNMSKVGLTTYSASLSVSARKDITKFYMECLVETMHLYKMAKDVLLNKGLYIRPPFMTMDDGGFVEREGFMKDIFGEKRPLIAIEIANLYTNIQRNHLGTATLIGFSQVSQSEDATQFFVKCIEIGQKNVTLFEEKLKDSYLPAPMSWSAEITKSTSYTFSDKLMMFYTTGLIALSIGYFGIAIAESPRMDLTVMYNRLSLEIQKLSGDGMSIMINNKWLEEPPIVPDRDELIKKK